MSSKAAKFRRHFGEPAAGPRACLRTRQAPAELPDVRRRGRYR